MAHARIMMARPSVAVITTLQGLGPSTIPPCSYCNIYKGTSSILCYLRGILSNRMVVVKRQVMKRLFSIANNPKKRMDARTWRATPMKDLNDIVYFAKIVELGSLSAASEALGVAKSMLSQHL